MIARLNDFDPIISVFVPGIGDGAGEDLNPEFFWMVWIKFG